jgi:hypothetical protein
MDNMAIRQQLDEHFLRCARCGYAGSFLRVATAATGILLVCPPCYETL